jgi:GNAT superfamily N-acetyltransferase
MNPAYSIVSARPGDIHALPAIELAAAVLLRGHAPDAVLSKATDEAIFAEAQRHGRLWVALRGDRAVGFALVKMLADDLPHLEELDVEPSHGRRGVGTALVRTVCEWGRRSGYAQLTLTTYRAVAWNMPFYSRLGFVEIPAADLRRELAAVVREEAERGMAPESRVVMSHPCAV